MIETVEGNAGTVVPPKGYLTAVRELCSRYNVLFIADEIQSGFGRTGYFMAYDCENVKPDIVVLGKSLTGGAYSMGLALGSRETIGTFKPGQYVKTSESRLAEMPHICDSNNGIQIRLNVLWKPAGVCVRYRGSRCCY